MPIICTTSAGTLSGLLENATAMLTWFISSMTSLVSFIIANPVILTGFLILLVGSVVGMFMRIWKSA